MQDTKNIFIAWICSAVPLAEALGSPSTISIVTAVVLPITFFAIGKAIDVGLQIYLSRRRR